MPPVRVALAQIAPRLGALKANLQRHHELIAQAREQGADLVVFPELGLTGYLLQDLNAEVAMRRNDPRLLELAMDVDLLIHDAQYTPEEFETKRDWGHCTPEYAVWLAATSRVKRLALFHHDPAHDDDELDTILGAAIECAASKGVDAFAARERTTVDI